jgi:hypothetical protein
VIKNVYTTEDDDGNVMKATMYDKGLHSIAGFKVQGKKKERTYYREEGKGNIVES